MQQHYFSANTAGKLDSFTVDVVLGGEKHTITSAKGVFSSNGIDKGTAVMLKYLQSERSNLVELPNSDVFDILDLGCGWGTITLEIALRFLNSRVIAVDINQHALALTNLNAQKLGLINVQTKPKVTPEMYFDLILSNPPIRIGKVALLKLLHQHLEKLRNSTARAYFVIQKNLGADSIATKLAKSWQVRKLASSKGFRVLEVRIK